MPSTKDGQTHAPVPIYNLVLTYNPEDGRLKDILAYIQRHKLPVYPSRVGGFGRPELRISHGHQLRDGVDIVKGVDDIFNILESLKEQLQ